MENGRPQGSDREPPLSHNWPLRQITITFREYLRDSGWENIKRKRVARQMVDLLMQAKRGVCVFLNEYYQN